MTTHTGQSHPIGIYLKIWGLLFVLSAASYMVDYLHLQGYLRWSLILIFMFLKAGLIVAIFMHMVWERLAFVYAIVLPPLLLIGLIGIGALEGEHTFLTRNLFFSENDGSSIAAPLHGSTPAHGSAPAHGSTPSAVGSQ